LPKKEAVRLFFLGAVKSEKGKLLSFRKTLENEGRKNSDKAKSAARRRRKATGLTETAGLPRQEGGENNSKPDKAKSVVRRRRKATGLTETAGLPESVLKMWNEL
jgi:hypothetical protein